MEALTPNVKRKGAAQARPRTFHRGQKPAANPENSCAARGPAASVAGTTAAIPRPFLEVFRHPAVWLILALLMNVLEGALRKWLPGFDGGPGRLLAYFGKDLFFGLAVLCTLGWPRHSGPALGAFNCWTLRAMGVVALGAAISYQQGFNIVGAVLSVRVLVLLPLCVSAYAGRVRGFPLLGCAVVIVMLSCVNLALGLIQNQLPETHVLNRYAAGEMGAKVEHGVRATGTFAYITGMSVMCAAGVWAGMVILSLGQGWKHQWVGVCGIMAGVGCGFASISRGAVVTAIAMLGLWGVSCIRATNLLWRVTWMAGLALLLAVMLVPGTAGRFLHVGRAALDRFSEAGDSNIERALGQWAETVAAARSHPWGLGPGTEQVGGNYATSGEMTFLNYESQLPRIVAEFGLPGLVGFFLLIGGTVWSLQVAKSEVESPRWRLALTATQLFVLGQAYGNVVFNHTASSFVWVAVAATLAGLPQTMECGTAEKGSGGPGAGREWFRVRRGVARPRKWSRPGTPRGVGTRRVES